MSLDLECSSLKLSSLNNNDKRDLLEEIKKIVLQYRTSLKLPKSVTFGIEIEFCGAVLETLEEIINKNFFGWDVKFDETTTKFKDGLHIGGEVSSDILIDNISCWKNIEKVCRTLRSKKARINSNCGGHVHAGAHILNTPLFLVRFIKLIIAYEPIIFRFSYGEYLGPRKTISSYARPMGLLLRDELDYFQECVKEDNFRAITKEIAQLNNYCFRFRNIKKRIFDQGNTFEDRTFNGTLNPIMWQNYIDFFLHLALFATSDDYNEELIDEKIKQQENKYNNLESFNEIYLDDALELADMIYPDILSELYFLKIYFKNFIDVNNYDKKIRLTKNMSRAKL